ncbi:RidA family protein [Rhodocytophaga rosea]|uniref:RidA family protein n=1 Tax=Rhodocytophaga rosea TaxID=2704465 RepID=A0A6C0GQG7_9BACT|nr:RidA family protein [Rhodocytophaga rosea]QHT70299.1 RidA family protein [Rhodocytophaga rosea]
MKKHYINPPALPDWSNMFTQIVVTEKNGLRLIHISGQVGVDADKIIAGKDNLQAQTHQALINLKIALASAGAQVSDVVKLVVYVVHYQYAQAAIIREELRMFFPENRLPALSLIGVAALADLDFLIEIDAEAISEIITP